MSALQLVVCKTWFCLFIVYKRTVNGFVIVLSFSTRIFQKETVVPVVVKDEALPEAPTRKKPSTDSTAAAPAKATPTTSASSPTRRVSRSRNGDSERRQNEEGVFQFLFGCCIGR